MSILIEPIEDLEGIYECQRLQREIWGFSDLSIIPHHVVLTTVHAGGLLLGAYDQNQLIGFAYSLPGFFSSSSSQEFILRQCSMMAAVLPSYQSQGIGYALKMKQRDHVLAQGVKLITWTFDPLQSLNARFNFGKLGVICRSYSEDLYGDMRDELNKGLPTDRFQVEWWINSERVRSRQTSEQGDNPDLLISKIPTINETDYADGLLHNATLNLNFDQKKLLLQIPQSLAQIKLNAPELALKWRMETREILRAYLAKGYLVTDLRVQKANLDREVFYMLEHRELNEVLENPYGD